MSVKRINRWLKRLLNKRVPLAVYRIVRVVDPFEQSIDYRIQVRYAFFWTYKHQRKFHTQTTAESCLISYITRGYQIEVRNNA